MNVLSICDGMSCGQIALKGLGIPVENYYASEIDKFAIKQTQLNFPGTIQLGDMENWHQWDIDWSSIDLVLAGTPCQGFSFAGKQLAFDDPRSRLFFVFVDILNHVRKFNPSVKFLLENVKMKKEYLRIITGYMGVHPVLINSALVSAQNRERYYWTNIRTKQVGLFGELHSDIPQPEDRGILLKDILEDEVDERYYLSNKILKVLNNRPKGYDTLKILEKDSLEKTRTIRAGIAKMATNDTYIKENIICISSNQSHATMSINKSTPLVAAMGMGGGHVPMIVQKERGFNNGGIFKEKSPTLSSNSWKQNNLVIQLNPSKESGGKQPYQQNRVYSIEGKLPALSAELGGRSNIFLGNIYSNNSQGGKAKSATINGEAGGGGAKTGLYLTGSRIRRLTPLEVSRLQTIPEWYKWECSDTQIYKMCGNGWTIEVIKHVLQFLKFNEIIQIN